MREGIDYLNINLSPNNSFPIRPLILKLSEGFHSIMLSILNVLNVLRSIQKALTLSSLMLFISMFLIVVLFPDLYFIVMMDPLSIKGATFLKELSSLSIFVVLTCGFVFKNTLKNLSNIFIALNKKFNNLSNYSIFLSYFSSKKIQPGEFVCER
jgi:hypothetical protein